MNQVQIKVYPEYVLNDVFLGYTQQFTDSVVTFLIQHMSIRGYVLCDNTE